MLILIFILSLVVLVVFQKQIDNFTILGTHIDPKLTTSSIVMIGMSALVISMFAGPF